MKNEFKGTPGAWVADIRNGCAAIYHKDRSDDTPGCHRSDERNIAYSSKGASYDAVEGRWSLDPSVEHDFRVMAASPRLLSAIQSLVNIYDNDGTRLYTAETKRRALDEAHAAIAQALGETE